MKKVLFLIGALMTQTSFATISNSNYEARHLAVIEKAILNNCGEMVNLSVVSAQEEKIKVDQGIIDIEYKTVLSADNALISVESTYFDSYDHEEREWGSYHVDSINCQLQ